MSKTPTAEDRRAARQAEIAEQQRRQAETARDDAELNAPVLAALNADIALLDELADRLKAKTAELIPAQSAVTTLASQVDTLAVLHGNLNTLVKSLAAYGDQVIAAHEAAA